MFGTDRMKDGQCLECCDRELPVPRDEFFDGLQIALLSVIHIGKLVDLVVDKAFDRTRIYIVPDPPTWLCWSPTSYATRRSALADVVGRAAAVHFSRGPAPITTMSHSVVPEPEPVTRVGWGSMSALAQEVAKKGWNEAAAQSRRMKKNFVFLFFKRFFFSLQKQRVSKTKSRKKRRERERETHTQEEDGTTAIASPSLGGGVHDDGDGPPLQLVLLPERWYMLRKRQPKHYGHVRLPDGV